MKAKEYIAGRRAAKLAIAKESNSSIALAVKWGRARGLRLVHLEPFFAEKSVLQKTKIAKQLGKVPIKAINASRKARKKMRWTILNKEN